LLAPFLTPPAYEGSWADPEFAWNVTGAGSLDIQSAAAPLDDVLAKYCWNIYPPFPKILPGWEQLTTVHTTIWYQTSGDIWPSGTQLATPEETVATAKAAAAVIEHIIKKETELMGRWPLFDTNEVCGGGDGSIDIYITRKSSRTGAQAVPFPPGEVQRPGFIWLAPDYFKGDPMKVRDALAHEFFHLISMSSPQARELSDKRLPEYEWLDEATANWMIDYVYKDDQFEHGAAPDYLNQDYATSLELGLEHGTNGYADYVFLQFLDLKLGSQVMRAIWDATPKYDSLAAINEATKGAGGFEKLWPEFALVAWNDWQNGFLDDLYRWDRLETGLSQAKNPWAPTEVELGGKRIDDAITFSSGIVDHLAIGLTRYIFGDPNVRTVLFNNTLVEEPGTHIWALLKIAGKWQVEDWTEKRYTQFCRQRDSERVEEIVILITNSLFDREPLPDDPRPYIDPKLEFTNLACGEWQGTVTAVHRDDRTGRYDLETIHTTATFEPDMESFSLGSSFSMFQLKEGTMHWGYTGTLGDCQIQADTVDIPLEPPDYGSFSIRQWAKDTSLIGQFSGTGGSWYEPTLTYVCPNGSYEVPWQTMPWLETGSDTRVSADGKSIIGRYERGTPGDGRSVTVEWNFVAVSPDK
jgi:hypothetical protein